MKKIFILTGIIIALLACDTQQTVIDTGVSSPYFDGSIMSYLRADKFNWELTVQVIERAGLTDLFEGDVDSLPEITFWGPTSYSIQRYLFDSQYESNPLGVFKTVQDMPVDLCRNLILKHVMKGKVLKKDIGYRDFIYLLKDQMQTGGSNFVTLGNSRLRAAVDKSDYADVPEAGPETLYLYSFTAKKDVPLACPDIQPKNGVVHSLNYGYGFGEI